MSRRSHLRCNIEQFQFSAHASRESIIAYVKKLAPQESRARARRSASGGMDAGTSPTAASDCADAGVKWIVIPAAQRRLEI